MTNIDRIVSTPAVRFANWGHRQPSTFVRRTSIILAMVALSTETLVVWLILYPLFTIAYAPLMGIIGFIKALIEIPRLSYNSATSDAKKWARNWQGAQRIWRRRKVDSTLIRNTEYPNGQ